MTVEFRSTGWSLERMPNFVADDAALMLVELIALQAEAMRQGVTDEARYALAYARVFAGVEPRAWVHLPPATVANGITALVREVGVFVLIEDDLALATLERETAWRTRLPPVHIARPGPVYTPSRLRQFNNRSAFEALVHRAAALAYAERLPGHRIGSRREGTALYHTVVAMFDGVIAEANQRNDGTARALRRIQAMALQLINARMGHEPEDGILALPAELPSLVCAHLAYREARQAPRIRTANPVAHPSFMPRQIVVPPWP